MNPVLGRWLPFLALCVAFGMAWVLSDYQRAVASYIGIFALVCVGLVLMTGVAGMVSFGQAAFVGLGAYATGYLTTAYQCSPWFGLLFALVGAAVIATLIGLMTVRMSGHYLALVTLCFCISFYFLVGNLEVLGRFNVFTRIKRVRKAGYRDGWHLYVYGVENQLRFLDEIGVNGLRGDKARALAEAIRAVKPNTNLDTIPAQVWDDVRGILAGRGMTHRAFAAALGTQFCGSTMWKHAPSRQRMAKVAAVLDDADLEVLATNDVYWDSIASIELVGEQEVYDATVLGTHNFVVEGIAAHNSLEQDADMVILLHRDDVYEKESTRPGEADLIVAKHRNGPTRDITVAFQGHYSRFVDMAH